MGSAPSTPIAQCLTAAVPNVAFPSKIDYQIANVKPYNLDIKVSPAAVTYPTTAEHIQAIVKCANQLKLKVQAKSGGHSYGNYANGGSDKNTIVVDLKNMNSIQTDPTSWIATIGAGSLLGPITESLASQKRAFAHGTCPQVGIGGHATIGGLGPASRMWGSALDHVVEATVVLANSSVVTVSDTQNPDLFFALKGAGASFGVITEFKIKTHESLDETVQFKYTFAGRPYANQAKRFKAWQTLISDPGLTRKFASQIIFYEAGMILTGTYFGPKAEFDALNITSVFPGILSGQLDVVTLDSWLGTVANWGEELALKLIGGFSSAFYAKSLAFTKADIIPDNTIDAFFQYLDKTDHGTPIWFAIFDLEGGAINDVPQDATAYAHRDALFYFQPYVAQLLPPLSATSKNFLQGMIDTLTTGVPSVTKNGAYAGYVDPALGEQGQLAYWGTNYPRLQQLKAKYDPTDVFHNPQSVRLP